MYNNYNPMYLKCYIQLKHNYNSMIIEILFNQLKHLVRIKLKTHLFIFRNGRFPQVNMRWFVFVSNILRECGGMEMGNECLGLFLT